MQIRVSKIVQNTAVQKAAHHSNLIPTLDSTIAAVLDQVAIFDFQLGPDLNYEQFSNHCICMRLSNLTFTGKKNIEVNVLAFFNHDILFPAEVTVFQIGEARKRPGEAEKFPSSERFIYALWRRRRTSIPYVAHSSSTSRATFCARRRQTPRTAS